MNFVSYKDIVTSRGYKYHYYCAPAKGNKPVLLFAHGFPNTSRDWRLVVPYFEEKGYGVIVPDMLGYAGSDKPTNPEEYQYNLLTKDLIDILDAENVEKAVAIGHDWGVGVVSRLANYYPERFFAYAFFNVPYMRPNPHFQIEELMATTKGALGYEPFGYWFFFAEEGADKIIEDNIESFMSATFPKRSDGLKSFAGRGSLKSVLLNKFTAPLADFMTEEEQKTFIETFRKGGFAAPLCYYKVVVSGARNPADALIPNERHFPPVSSPMFFGAALRDRVCDANIGKSVMTQNELKDHKVTIKEFDGDHWLLLSPETANEVNTALGDWIENVVFPSLKARV